MEKSVSAADANRRFSELLRMVREGHSYIVTAHGKPIARLGPIDSGEDVSRQALSALIKRLRSERPTTIGHWKRDELYEDEK